MSGRGGTSRRCEPRAGSERGGILFKLAALIFLLVCLGLAYVLRHPLLRAAGESLVVDETPQHSDAIVILSDDNEEAQRAGRAADLFHGGWAPTIVASGRYLRPYLSVADLMQHDLTDRGVPASAIVRFPQHATNTRDEAILLRGFCQTRGWRRLLVVTSNYHTRRARYIFRGIFPSKIEIRVVAAPDANYDPNTWWHTRVGIKFFCMEYESLPVAVWEMHEGNQTVNQEPAPVGAPANR